MLILIRLLILLLPVVALVFGAMWYRGRRARRHCALAKQEVAKLFFDHFLRDSRNRELTYQQMVLAWEQDKTWAAHFVFDHIEKNQTKIRAVYPWPESHEWHAKFLKNAAKYQTDLDNVIYGDLEVMQTANHSLLLKEDLTPESPPIHFRPEYMMGQPVMKNEYRVDVEKVRK
jgi:hypothetical protein